MTTDVGMIVADVADVVVMAETEVVAQGVQEMTRRGQSRCRTLKIHVS